MKKKLYVAMCLSLAMSLPGVVDAAQRQENIPSSSHGIVNVRPVKTAFAVTSGRSGDDQNSHKWQDRVQENNRQQYPTKDNVQHDGNNHHDEDKDGNRYGNDKENPGKHLGNNKDNPGKHLGHDKDSSGKHFGHDQENYDNHDGHDRNDNDKHDGHDRNDNDKHDGHDRN